MSRPAFIEKLFQPAKWIFKKELIPMDDLAGPGLEVVEKKLNVDFSSMPPDQMRNIVLAMVRSGGGLVADSKTGKIYFDPESMDTQVFDKMLKALRLPKWLTGNTQFYVNKSHAAADTLDEGRGLSADKPFKTIQACVNYVCNNYNVGSYEALIRVADGDYPERLFLGEYSRTTGHIRIMAENAPGVKIAIPQTIIALVSGGFWQLDGLDMETGSPARPTATNWGYPVVLQATGGTTQLMGCKLTMDCSGITDLNTDKVAPRLVYAYSGGSVIFSESPVEERVQANRIVCHKGEAFLYLGSGGKITLDVSHKTPGEKIICSGDASHFINCIGGTFERNASALGVSRYFVVDAGSSVTGTRYRAVSGGKIDTHGQGPEFFPGSVAGAVEESTYSWYK